jgi:hypothetical protein
VAVCLCDIQLYWERQDGMYDLIPYYFARWVVQLPSNVVIAVLYVTPIYWMANFQVFGSWVL